MGAAGAKRIKSGYSGQTEFSVLNSRLEGRVSRLQLTGRYHLPPKRIEDEYLVCENVLGSGYNGAVRLAKGRGNPKLRFAVKSFKLDTIPADKRSQLESEIEVFLVVDHPHIARLFEVYECDGKLQLVMECLEGGELFDRVTEKKRFSEADAASTVWQMLLALNYIHTHGVVHRDLKLENFLYEKKGGNILKLIDFGFSKTWNPTVDREMRVSCGTLSYVAPEVLDRNYTSQCDLWSLGVIVFILLSGYMPFFGPEPQQTRNIQKGRFTMKPERWDSISADGRNFTESLMRVDPKVRLNAQQALKHPWIANRDQHLPAIDNGIVDALRDFGHASRFRRCCMEMLAWSLSAEDRAKMSEYFIAMDVNHHGTVTLGELRSILVDKFNLGDEETKEIFAALDSNHDEEIHYSSFLAAVMATRISLHDDLLHSAFSKFDTDNSGFITRDNLVQVLGDQFEGHDVAELLEEADVLHDGRISYPEFAAFVRETQLEKPKQAATKMIDRQAKENGLPPVTWKMRRQFSGGNGHNHHGSAFNLRHYFPRQR